MSSVGDQRHTAERQPGQCPQRRVSGSESCPEGNSTHDCLYSHINPLTPTVAIWVGLYSILCQTGLSRRLQFLTSGHSDGERQGLTAVLLLMVTDSFAVTWLMAYCILLLFNYQGGQSNNSDWCFLFCSTCFSEVTACWICPVKPSEIAVTLVSLQPTLLSSHQY